MKHPVDVTVGARVRELRIKHSMSQTKLGDAIGVTFQQIQKYENGSNRMGASRLMQVATALRVPVAYLFEGIDGPGAGDITTEPMQKEAAKVARDWAAIEDPAIQRTMRQILRTFARGAGDGAVPIRSAA